MPLVHLTHLLAWLIKAYEADTEIYLWVSLMKTPLLWIAGVAAPRVITSAKAEEAEQK